MRWIVLLILAIGTVAFALQNWQPVPLYFLGNSPQTAILTLSLPLAVWVLLAIAAGLLTSAVLRALIPASRSVSAPPREVASNYAPPPPQPSPRVAPPPREVPLQDDRRRDPIRDRDGDWAVSDSVDDWFDEDAPEPTDLRPSGERFAERFTEDVRKTVDRIVEEGRELFEEGREIFEEGRELLDEGRERLGPEPRTGDRGEVKIVREMRRSDRDEPIVERERPVERERQPERERPSPPPAPTYETRPPEPPPTYRSSNFEVPQTPKSSTRQGTIYTYTYKDPRDRQAPPPNRPKLPENRADNPPSPPSSPRSPQAPSNDVFDVNYRLIEPPNRRIEEDPFEDDDTDWIQVSRKIARRGRD